MKWLAVAAVAALLTQEIQPQVLPLRVDNLPNGYDVQIYLSCPPIMKPLAVAEQEAVTDIALRVVDLCPRGELVLDLPINIIRFPLARLVELEREGGCKSLLLCLRGPAKTRLLAFQGPEPPLSCASVES